MTIQAEINGEVFEFEAFGSTVAMESFENYVLRVVLPVFENIDILCTIRCSVSGFPIGRIDRIELMDTLRHAVAALDLNRLGDILNVPSERTIGESIESLADELYTRLLFSSRPGPALNKEMDRFAKSKLSKQRQLAILLNQLLWDAGLFRDKALPGSDDMIERLRRSAAVADQIILHWDDKPELQDLHESLIELDAVYRIKTLKFSRKELDQLLALRDSHSIKTGDLIKFVDSLLQHRHTANLEPTSTPARWTQEVYRRQMEFNMREREDFSNVIPQPTKTEIKKAEAKTPEARAKAKEKQELIDRFAAAFAAANTVAK